MSRQEERSAAQPPRTTGMSGVPNSPTSTSGAAGGGPPAYASRFQPEALELLRKASVARCAFAPEQACPAEWPDEPNMWCGSCLAREILRVG